MSDPRIPSSTGEPSGAYPPAAQPYPPAAPAAYVPPAPPFPTAPDASFGAPQAPVHPAPGYGHVVPAPQPQYPTYGTPSYPVYPPPRPTSGLAIASLVCGLAGILLSWLVVPALASIAAVICGHIALKQTKADTALGGRGMAFAGLILGYVGVALIIFVILIPIVMFLFFGAFTLPFLFAS